jgi:hypothetical protein
MSLLKTIFSTLMLMSVSVIYSNALAETTDRSALDKTKAVFSHSADLVLAKSSKAWQAPKRGTRKSHKQTIGFVNRSWVRTRQTSAKFAVHTKTKFSKWHHHLRADRNQIPVIESKVAT